MRIYCSSSTACTDTSALLKVQLQYDVTDFILNYHVHSIVHFLIAGIDPGSQTCQLRNARVWGACAQVRGLAGTSARVPAKYCDLH